MPLRAFWVILIGKTPTSFRGKLREDLVPTLRQLQRTQSDVSLRWFERGKIWESPQAAEGAAKLAATAAREKRTKEWRPGGDHRDPRARVELTRDQKRAKFKRDQRRPEGAEAPGPRAPRDDRSDRRPREERPDKPESPFGPRRSGPLRTDSPRPDRPWSRPKFDRGPRRPRPDSPQSPFGDRRRADRPGGFKPPKRRP